MTELAHLQAIAAELETAPGEIQVRTEYTFNGSFAMDDAAHKAAGRSSDFSGCGMQSGKRDLGWICQSNFEAEKIKRALTKIGMRAIIQVR